MTLLFYLILMHPEKILYFTLVAIFLLYFVLVFKLFGVSEPIQAILYSISASRYPTHWT